VAASVTIGVPMAPQATARVRDQIQHRRLERPESESTMTAPAIATGVPNPDVPSIIAPNEKAMSKHLKTAVERNVNDRFLHDLELSGDHRHRVEEHPAEDIQMMPRKPGERAERKRRHRRPSGHPEAHSTRQERGDDAVERGVGRRDARCFTPRASRMWDGGYEYQEDAQRDRVRRCRQQHVTQRVKF
jgi:hypothetical protein